MFRFNCFFCFLFLTGAYVHFPWLVILSIPPIDLENSANEQKKSRIFILKIRDNNSFELYKLLIFVKQFFDKFAHHQSLFLINKLRHSNLKKNTFD